MSFRNYKVLPLLLLVPAALAIHAIIMRPKQPLSAVLLDGTKVTVEQVSSGLNHDYSVGSKPYADFLKYWPKFLPKLPAGKYRSLPLKSTKDQLVTWVSWQTSSNKFVSPHIMTCIEDEHGCEFADTGNGSGTDSGDGKMALAAVTYPVYPRRQKQFKMLVQKWPGFGIRATPPVTLLLPNPKQLSPVEWKPEPFPIVKQTNDLKMRENGWARDGDIERAVEWRKARMLDEYRSAQGKNGLPPFTNQELLIQLLELKPKKQYYGSGPNGMGGVTEPEDQWLSEKDVVSYIKKHPAVFRWMPVTLNIPENLNLIAPKSNTENIKPVAAPQSSAPGMIRGMLAKKYRHVTAAYFLMSSAKDTYEGQKMAAELVKHGIGIEFLPYIYFDAQNLGISARGAELHPQSKGIMEQRRSTLISEYCSATGRKGLPPFPDRDLLPTLLDLHPTKEYEPNDIKTITAVTESEDQWLSEQDVMSYIKKHPATNSPK